MINEDNQTSKAPGAVDVSNDRQMVRLGIRPPMLEEIHLIKNSDAEKKQLRRLRKSFKGDSHFAHLNRKHEPNYEGRLIVCLSKNNVFPNTTYSIKCWRSQISGMLERYTVNEKSVVSSYRFI